MEENFRLVLIVISAFVIGAILIHGLWTIRKNKNPYKLKTKNSQVEPETREFDSAGFDQTGVGSVKVVGTSAEVNIGQADEPELTELPVEPEYTESNLVVEVSDEQVLTDPVSASVVNQALEDINKNYDELNQFAQSPELATELTPDEVQEELNSQDENELQQAQSSDLFSDPELDNETRKEPSFTFTELDEAPEITEPDLAIAEKQEPQLGAVPVNEPVKSAKPATPGRSKKASDDQIDFDFDESARPQVDLEPEVIALSVTMPEGQYMSGAALLPSLLTLGLRFGDMDIFHRHQDNAGNGAVTFSLANMLKPGTFDLDRMESFATKGVTLFMTLPNEGDAFEVFEQMLSSAKHLAKEFNGQLLDSQRSVMTKQTEQHYLTRIREFERKARIAGF